MSLTDAMQMVCNDSQKIAATCRACGVKNTQVCQERECDNYIELLSQLILVKALKEQGFVRGA